MALGRNHVLVIVAIAGIMALTLAGAGLFSGRQTPGFVRINVSDKSAVWLEFNGASLRAAASVEELKTAEPVPLHARGFQRSQSGELALPIPADQFPAGISAVKGSFTRTRNSVSGQLGICRTDAQKVVWQCDVGVLSKTGNRADAAPAIPLPSLERLALIVTGEPANGKLGIGVRLAAGDNPVTGVLRDGKPVPVQLRVTDAAGKEVAARKGPLADFGFS
ncbi:MAG: hypothetical protein ACLQVA_04030 [Candidatus Brocadiia bacterium]